MRARRSFSRSISEKEASFTWPLFILMRSNLWSMSCRALLDRTDLERSSLAFVCTVFKLFVPFNRYSFILEFIFWARLSFKLSLCEIMLLIEYIFASEWDPIPKVWVRSFLMLTGIPPCRCLLTRPLLMMFIRVAFDSRSSYFPCVELILVWPGLFVPCMSK